MVLAEEGCPLEIWERQCLRKARLTFNLALPSDLGMQ